MNGRVEQLELQLKATLEAWTDEGVCPPERFEALIAGARQQRRAPLLRWAAAAAVVLALLMAVPQIRAWAAEVIQRLPVVGQFLGRMADHERLSGWAWAEQHGQFQTVMAEVSDQGYTIRIHEVLADVTQTTLIYTVEGPEPFTLPYVDVSMMPYFENSPLLGGRGTFGEMIDGVYVGAAVLAPLPVESGTLKLMIPLIATWDWDEIHDKVTGNWDLSFPVSRAALSAVSRVVEVNREMQAGPATLMVERLVLSPVQTALVYSKSDPDLSEFGGGFEPRLLAGDRELVRTAGGLGLAFEPVPEGTVELTLVIDGLMMNQAVAISLPVEEGATTSVEGGYPLRVDQVTQHSQSVQIVVSFPHGEGRGFWHPYEEWSLLDDQGRRYWLKPGSGEKPTPDRATLRFTLSLPEGRTPAALEAQRAWVRIDGPWEMSIPLR